MSGDIQTFPTRVFTNPEEDLQIVSAELTRSELNFNLVIDVLNLSEVIAKSVKFDVKFLDSFGKYLFDSSVFDFYEDNLEILPHSVFYLTPIPLNDALNSARGVKISITSAEFEDGTIITYNQYRESQYTLPAITKDKRDKLHSVFGKEVVTYGENFGDAWRCVCGALNFKELQSCRNCNREKNFVLNNLTEPLINIKLLNLISSNSDSDESMDFTSTSLSKTAERTEIVSESRINENMPDERPKKRRIGLLPKILLGLLTVIVLAFSALAFLTQYGTLKTNRSLEEADNLYNNGQYESALVIYESLLKENKGENIASKVEDTKVMIDSNKAYLLGESLAEKGDYINAIKYYKQVLKEDKENYKESQDKIYDLEKVVLENVKEEYETGIVGKALNIINKYLEVVPESAEAQTLKSDMEKSRNTADPQGSSSGEQESEPSAEERLKEPNADRAKMTERAQVLLHSYQKVSAEQANIRTEPSLESEVITTVPTGSDVYIYETSIEGTERIWCKVEIMNAETGELLNGWISSRVLDV